MRSTGATTVFLACVPMRIGNFLLSRFGLAVFLLPPLQPRLAFGADPPALAVSADAKAHAPQLAAPIAEVTVYSDRARVRRRGTVQLGKTPLLVRLPDLPGATFLDSVRVSVQGKNVRVIRVEATPVEREHVAMEDAARLLDAIDVVDDQLAANANAQAAFNWEIVLASAVSPASPVAEELRDGRKALVPDTDSWFKSLDFLSARRESAQTEIGQLQDATSALGLQKAKLQADLGKLNPGGLAERRIEAVVVLEGEASSDANVELEYFVPGAFWKPVYDLHFESGRNVVRMETAAMVVQATGEDWSSVEMHFSTAAPGQGLDLPELLTWTLGEKDDFLMQARPVHPMSRPRTFPLPEPQPLAIDAERAARNEVLLARLERNNVDLIAVEQEELTVVERFDGKFLSNLPLENRTELVGVLANQVAGAVNGSQVRGGNSAQNSYQLEGFQRGESSSAEAIATQQLYMQLFQSPSVSRRLRFSDPFLPAVSAGGLDHVYRAPTRASIASSGSEVRIPLDASTFGVSVYHESTPSLEPTAYLKARVRNTGKRPVLRGPATIFSDGEFVGRGEIDTTGPGGVINMPLGADRDVRLIRRVVPSTTTTGLLSKTDETTYAVEIQVGNYKKKPIIVDVIDQFPKSSNEKVRVHFLDATPKPMGPTEDKIMRFRVTVAPGQTETIKLRYRIDRPNNTRLYQ